MKPKKTTLLGVSISMVWISLVYLIANSSFGFNPIKIHSPIKNAVWLIAPQGWGFFTRNPREDRLDLYNFTIDNKLLLETIPNASFDYLYGFTRKMRFKGAQLGLIIAQTPTSMWCSNFELTEFRNMPKLKITNPFNFPILCGDYLLIRTESLPWAWSKNMNILEMPRQYLRLEIKCNNVD